MIYIIYVYICYLYYIHCIDIISICFHASCIIMVENMFQTGLLFHMCIGVNLEIRKMCCLNVDISLFVSHVY